MRAYDRKKLYRQMVKDQVKAGRIPEARGGWVAYDSGKSAYHHMYHGHRAGGK